MGTISYKEASALFKAYSNAQYAFRQQLAGMPFDSSKRDILYSGNHSEEFEESLKENIANNINNKAGLKIYIEDIYYNYLIVLLMRFKELRRDRFNQIGQSREDEIKSKNYDEVELKKQIDELYYIVLREAPQDDIFLIISNGYLGNIAHLLNEVKSHAKEWLNLKLRSAAEISIENYPLGGRYNGAFSDELKHRHHGLIYAFKVEAGCIDSIPRKEQIALWGKNREKAIDKANSVSTKYIAATAPELEKIIPYLADCPGAQKAAENKLAQLKNTF